MLIEHLVGAKSIQGSCVLIVLKIEKSEISKITNHGHNLLMQMQKGITMICFKIPYVGAILPGRRVQTKIIQQLDLSEA